MHEFSIAQALVDQIENIAHENRLECVESIELETGSLREVVSEVMQTAFKASCEGTVAQGAELRLSVKPARAVCLTCQQLFKPSVHDYSCPKCSQTKIDIIEGNKILLMSIKGKQQTSPRCNHEN